MSQSETKTTATPVGYAVAGLFFLLFGALVLGSTILVTVLAMTGVVGPPLQPVGAVLIALVQVPGLLLFALVPVGLIATAVTAFTLARRAAVDRSKAVVVVAQRTTQVSLYWEYFPLHRTRWSGFWSDLRATMTLKMGWRLYFGLYALWMIPTTIYLGPLIGEAAVVPIIVAESAIGVALIVWHRILRGRFLVTSVPPRGR